MTAFSEFKARCMEDPEFRAAYEALSAKFDPRPADSPKPVEPDSSPNQGEPAPTHGRLR